MLRRLTVYTVVGSILVWSLVTSTAYGMLCPSAVYLGNDPEGLEKGWVNALQGIAHFVDERGNGYWFFTQTNALYKIALQDDMSGDYPKTSLEQLVMIDPKLKGYDHFGDLDQYEGYLFIPVTAREGQKPPKIVVLRATDLFFLGAIDFPASPDYPPQRQAPWIAMQALNPSNALLYSSNNELTPDDPTTPEREDALFRYNVDMNLLRLSRRTEDLAASITFKDPFPLREANGGPLQQSYANLQGGVFSLVGDLFLVNGLAKNDAKDDNGGIHMFSPLGEVMLNSTDFNYEYHGGFPNYQEPEGVDWWQLDTLSHAQGSGDLHVIMVDHDVKGHRKPIFKKDCGSPCHEHDQLFLKHYSVDVPDVCIEGVPPGAEEARPVIRIGVPPGAEEARPVIR